MIYYYSVHRRFFTVCNFDHKIYIKDILRTPKFLVCLKHYLITLEIGFSVIKTLYILPDPDPALYSQHENTVESIQNMLKREWSLFSTRFNKHSYTTYLFQNTSQINQVVNNKDTIDLCLPSVNGINISHATDSHHRIFYGLTYSLI